MSDDEYSRYEESNKGDAEGKERKFGCPCGKRYLSYPALFTHVKQKHNGKAPGDLIKPKTKKARGRPRIPVLLDEEEDEDHFDYKLQVEKLAESVEITYDGTFECSKAGKSCQTMASEFFEEFKDNQSTKKTVTCFLNYIKTFIVQKQSEEEWNSASSDEIIQNCNQLVSNYELYTEEFPLPRTILVQMLFLLFRWMYKHKWTDHKIIKRIPSIQIMQSVDDEETI